MKQDSKTISFREAISIEVQQFVEKIGKISQDYQIEFQADRFQMFDNILSYLIPASENQSINNQSLSNFLQSTLNNQTEKKLKKLYCAKQITRVSNNSKLFANLNSSHAFQSYIQGTLLSHQSNSSGETPFHLKNFSSFHHVVPLKNLKEEPREAQSKSDSSSLYQGKDSEIKKNYKLYSNPIKLEIIQYVKNFVKQALKNTTKDASEKYNVSIAKINHWTRSIKKVKQTRGRKPVDPEMEERVCIWLKNELGKGSILTQRIIRERAKMISCSDDFKASKGWLEKFFKRRPQLFEAYSHNRKNVPENQDEDSEIKQNMNIGGKLEEAFREDPLIKIQELLLSPKSEESG